MMNVSQAGAGKCFESVEMVDSPNNISFLNNFFPERLSPLVINFTVDTKTSFQVSNWNVNNVKLLFNSQT